MTFKNLYERIRVALLGPATIGLRDLTDIEVTNIDLSDYPDFCDAYIETAYSEQLGRHLTEEEIAFITEASPGFVYETVYEASLGYGE